MKYLKDDYKPKGCLLNPNMLEIRKISKEILDNVIVVVRSSIEVNQWMNTDKVIIWFINIKEKNTQVYKI